MQAIIEFLFHLLGDSTLFKLMTKTGRNTLRAEWEQSSSARKTHWIVWNLILLAALAVLLLLGGQILKKGMTSIV